MSNGAVDVIDLISSDDEAPPNIVPIPTFPSAPQTPVPKRPRAPSRPPSVPVPGSIDDDDEVEFVSHVTKKSRSANTTPNANNAGKPEALPENNVPVISGDEDADLIVVSKKTGVRANVDYPHNRFSCGIYPWGTSDKRQYCEKCYCYVCDDVASKCAQWNYHCSATDKVVKWRSERARAARARNARSQSTATFKKRTSRDFFTPRNVNRWNNNTNRRGQPALRSPLAINARDIIPPASFATSMPSFVSFQDNVLAILNNNRHQIDASALSQTRAHGILPPITASAANALEALDSALSLQWPRPEPPRLASSALLHTPAVPRPAPRSAPAQASRINNVAIPPLSAPVPNGLPRPPFETDRNSNDGFSYEEVRRMWNAAPMSGSAVPRMSASNTGGARTSRTWTVPQDVDNSPTKLPPLVSPNVPVQSVLPPAPPPAPVANNVSLPPLVDAELPLPPRKRNITAVTSSATAGGRQQTPIADTSKDVAVQETSNCDIAKNNFSISSLVQPQNTNSTTPNTTTASAQVDDGPAVPPQAGTEFGEDGLANHLLSPFLPNFGDTSFNIDTAADEVSLFPGSQTNVAATSDTAQPMQGVSQPDQGQAANMRRREPTSPGSSSQSGHSSPAAAAERIQLRAQDAVMDPLKGLMNMGLESGPITMGDLGNVLNKNGEQ